MKYFQSSMKNILTTFQYFQQLNSVRKTKDSWLIFTVPIVWWLSISYVSNIVSHKNIYVKQENVYICVKDSSAYSDPSIRREVCKQTDVNFDSELKHVAHLSKIMSWDTKKQSSCGWQFIYIYIYIYIYSKIYIGNFSFFFFVWRCRSKILKKYSAKINIITKNMIEF